MTPGVFGTRQCGCTVLAVAAGTLFIDLTVLHKPRRS